MLDAFAVQKAERLFPVPRLYLLQNQHPPFWARGRWTTKFFSTTYYEDPVQYIQWYLKILLIHTEQEVSTEVEQHLRRKRGYNTTLSLDSLSAGVTKGNWVSIIGNSQHFSSGGRTARFS